MQSLGDRVTIIGIFLGPSSYSCSCLSVRPIVFVLALVLLIASAPFVKRVRAASLNPSLSSQNQQEVVGPSDECVAVARRLSPSDKAEAILLEGGKSHCYKVDIPAQHFMRVVVEQRGSDVAISLFEPDESQKLKYKNVLPDDYELKEIDTPTGTSGAEPFSHIATVSGEHILIVRSILKAGQFGNYSIRLMLRQAEAGDGTFIKAERLFVKGWLICSQGIQSRNLNQFKQGVNLLKDAYSYAPALKNQQFEYACLSQLSLFALTLANASSGQDDDEEALLYIGKHIELCREIKNYQDIAQDQYNKGLFYLTKFKDIRKADETFNEISLQLERLSDDERNKPLLDRHAFLLDHAGARFYERGEYSYAVSYYEKALSVVEYARGRGFVLSEEPAIVNNIGTIYISIGEFEEAKKLYDRAYDLLISSHDDKDLLYGKAWITVNRGLTYYYLGKADTAIKMYYDAITAAKDYKKTLDPNESEFPDDPEIAALSNLGVASLRAGDSDTGVKHLRDASAVAEGVSPREKGRALTNLGRALSDSGRYVEAVSVLEAAISILRSTEYTRALGYAYTNKAFALNKLGKTKEAESFARDALGIQRALKDGVGEIGALYVWATLERDRGNLEKALEYIAQATDKLEPVRSSVSNASLRASFFTTAQPTFDFKVDLLMQMHRNAPNQGYAAKALDTHESSRARVFLDLLSSRIENFRQEFEQERVGREEHPGLYPHSFRGKSVEELLKTAELEKKLTQTVTDVLEQDSKLRSVAQPLKAERIQNDLESDVLLLEYRLSAERATLWAVRSDLAVEGYDLGLSADIKTLARKVIDGLSARGRQVEFETPKDRMKRIGRDEAGLPQASKELGKILLTRVLERMKGKRLVIVADGILQYVPFGALVFPTGNIKAKRAPYLIKEHEILYLPSASAFAQLTQIAKERKPLSKNIALFAPKFNGKLLMAQPSKSTEQLSGVDKSRATLQSDCLSDYRLPFRKLIFNLKETETLAALLKGQAKLSSQSVRLKPGAKATKQLIQDDEMSRYSVIHLATHGVYNDKRPECSGIALSPPDRKGNKGEAGGYLTMPETFDLNLSAELVVLSACETASGKDVQGEGIVGLTRAFLYSGASRVISSLWIVNTEANSVLMRFLYEGIFVKGQRPSQALQAAQKFMLRNSRYRNPYYWAGFIQQGVW